MSEITDKYKEDGILGYLDFEDDVERLMPGPSETERNESRLRHLVTGEKRPVSHIDHETKAWAHTNVGLPLLLSFMKYATKASKALRGTKAIEKSTKFRTPAGLQGKMRPAQEMAKEEVKETGKALKEAKKEAPKKLFERFMYTVDGGASDEIFNHRIAKQKAKDIDTAIDILSKNPAGRPGDVIDEAAAKSAGKTGLGFGAVKGAAKGVEDKMGNEEGGYDKGIPGFDDRLEMGMTNKALHFLKSLTGGDELDPEIWPMEIINDLILTTNADVGLWDREQLQELDDKEKVRFVMNMARGKYNTEDKDVKEALLQNYLKLTEGYEE